MIKNELRKVWLPVFRLILYSNDNIDNNDNNIQVSLQII